MLKARARDLGISESELMRLLLDGLLLGEEREWARQGARRGGAADALEGVLEETDQLAECHRFPEGFRFGRKKLYKDRFL